MLVARLSVWPHGDEEKAETIITVAIANVGGDEHVGKYVYGIAKGDKDPHRLLATGRTERRRRWKHGELEFDRHRGAEALLTTVLASAFKEELEP